MSEVERSKGERVVGLVGEHGGRGRVGRYLSSEHHGVAEFLRGHFALVLTSVFFVCCLSFTLQFHEMWRDELEPWEVARDSSNLPQLFHNLRYEGHPAPWYLLLFLITRFTHNPMWMQVAHVGIASLGVFLLARFAPFSRTQKSLYTFGYFPFYEYGVISRNYSLSVVVLFLYCVLVTRARKNYLLLGLTVFMLAETTAVALVLAPALGLYALLAYRQEQGSWLRGDRRKRRQLLAGAVIATVGSVGSLLQLLPPADTDTYLLNAGTHNLTNTVDTIWQALVPIPRRVVHSWGTNIVHSPSAMLWLSLALLVTGGIALKASKEIAATAAVGTVSLFGFYYFGYSGYLRHFGFLFLLFVICLWLLIAKQERTGTARTRREWRTMLLTILLLEQCVGAAIAVNRDWKRPFSLAKATATYLNSAPVKYLPIVVYGDYEVAPVLAYADKQGYFLQSQRQGSFVIWNNARTQPISPDEIVSDTLAYSQLHKERVMLISNAPVTRAKNNPHFKMILSRLREKPIVGDESYYLYRVYP